MPGDAAAETPEILFARVFRMLRPRTPVPAMEIQFQKFAGVSSDIRFHDGRLRARISDVLADAPASVLEALAWILLCKMFRKTTPARHLDRYRRYINRRDVVEAAENTKRERGRKQILPPRGRFFDLEAMFEDLNFRFFHGLMARPGLGWSTRLSRSILGHYDSAHHAIVMGRALDKEGVPSYVVEYVLYHEMLHLLYPVRAVAGRRCVHSAAFRKEEERYPLFQQATRWIQNEFHAVDFDLHAR